MQAGPIKVYSQDVINSLPLVHRIALHMEAQAGRCRIVDTQGRDVVKAGGVN